MEKKIEKWLGCGFIDKQTACKLLADVKEDEAKQRKIKLTVLIYTLAVIFIGLGVITFICANDWILELLNASDLLKILLMGTATIGSFWGGYELAYNKKNYPKLGNALFILASLLIGGTYALLGQIYNINADSSFLLFLWVISILPVAYIFRNRAINLISILLFILCIIFFYAELSIDKFMAWTVFIPLLCGLILYNAGNIPVVLNKYNDFSLSYKIVGILPVYITLLVLTCSVEESYQLTSPFYIVPLMLLMLFGVFNYIFQKNSTALLKIETISLVLLPVLLMLMLIAPYVSVAFVMLFANALLVAIIAFGFYYGYKFENVKIIGITNFMTTIYLTVNYCRWGWSFMDKSAFFIFGGIVLLALGIFLEKKRKEVITKDKK